jgi:hypothetical protein
MFTRLAVALDVLDFVLITGALVFLVLMLLRRI